MSCLSVRSFQEICRVCLAFRNEMNNLYDLNTTIPEAKETLAEMYQFCTSVNITSEDGLPGQLCSDCVAKLEQAYKFKNACQSSNNLLHHLLLEAKTDAKLKGLVETELDTYFIIEEPLNDSSARIRTDANVIDMPTSDEAERPELSLQSCDNTDNTNDIDDTANVPKIEKKFKCKDCPQQFSRQSSFSRHKNTHSNAQKYICSSCGKCFKRRDDFQRHNRIHTGEKPYQCTICQKKFNQSFQMKEHLRAHLRQKQFECEVCLKSFSRYLSRAKHMQTHQTTKSHTCNICSKKFSNIQLLNGHKKTHAPIKIKSCHKCPVCEKVFAKAYSLKIHTRLHSENASRKKTQKAVQCDICQRICTNASYLSQHMKKHADPQIIFQCGECPKNYMQLKFLIKHQKIHEVINKNKND